MKPAPTQRRAAVRLLLLAFVASLAFLQISLCVGVSDVSPCCDQTVAVTHAEPPLMPFVADDIPVSPGAALELCVVVLAVLFLALALLSTPTLIGLRAPSVRPARARPIFPSPPALTQLCVSRT